MSILQSKVKKIKYTTLHRVFFKKNPYNANFEKKIIFLKKDFKSKRKLYNFEVEFLPLS